MLFLMCSKNKSANSKHNVTSSTRGKFPADSRRDAAEYFMIMRNTDSCGFGGFTSRLLYSSTVQSGVTWQWAELTLSADWKAAPTLGLPSAADWTVGWQDGSMMWCQWKGACFISLTHRGWTRGRHGKDCPCLTGYITLRGLTLPVKYHSCSRAPSRDGKLLPWQRKLCILVKCH